ncbi:DNA-directed RNA polymerase I subunit RPA1, variant 2 [Balamuthia mandrillaris]
MKRNEKNIFSAVTSSSSLSSSAFSVFCSTTAVRRSRSSRLSGSALSWAKPTTPSALRHGAFFSAARRLKWGHALPPSSPFLRFCPSQRPFGGFEDMSRTYATSTAAQQGGEPKRPTLKALLNRFLLMVHPDLFSDYPQHQDVNSKSLQALHNFLDDTKRPPEVHVPSNKTYSLQFYLLSSASTLSDASSPSSSTELPKVEAIIHATPHNTRKGRERHILSQLLPLFERTGSIFKTDEKREFSFHGFWQGVKGLETQSGLSEDEAVAGAAAAFDQNDQQQYYSDVQHGPVNIQDLVEFISHHLTEAKKKKEDVRRIEREVALHRYVLMSQQRGLKVTFGREELNDPARQLDLMKKLVIVFDHIQLNEQPLDLTDCNICFSKASEEGKLYEDAFGRIFLDSIVNDHNFIQSWSKVLLGIELDRVRRQREEFKVTRLKEASLAERLGFRYFCADYTTINPFSYALFLRRIEAELEALGPQLFSNDMQLPSNISIVVKGGGWNRFVMDHGVGVLSIPTTCKAEDIVEWARRNGGKASHAQQVLDDLRARETQLRYVVLSILILFLFFFLSLLFTFHQQKTKEYW